MGDLSTLKLTFQIVSLAVWFIVTLAFGYYFLKFLKEDSISQIISKPKLIVWIVLSAIWVVFAILSLAITSGEWPILIISLVAMVFSIIYTWIYLTKFAISINEKKINFIGESIENKNILQIISDRGKHAVYINFMHARKLKRMKFSTSSVFGQFILKNSSITGHQFIDGDADDFFKKESSKR